MIDPRASAAECIAGEADSHGGIKDSKVVWVGQNSDRILTTGFSTVTVKCASVVLIHVQGGVAFQSHSFKDYVFEVPPAERLML